MAAGAVVRDCVIFADAAVAAGASVDWAVLADATRIGAEAQVGAAADEQPDADRLVLVGRDSRVGDHTMVPAGARLEPGTVA